MSTTKSATIATVVTAVALPVAVFAADQYAVRSIEFKNKLILWGVAAPESKVGSGLTFGEQPYAVAGVTSVAIWVGFALILWAAVFAGMSLSKSDDEADAAKYSDRLATNGYSGPEPQPAAQQPQQALPPGYAPYGAAPMGYMPQQPMIAPTQQPTNQTLPDNPGSG